MHISQEGTQKVGWLAGANGWRPHANQIKATVRANGFGEQTRKRYVR